MKKTLIALAALGFAGGVMAQSSVTLYGIADAGIGKVQHGHIAVNTVTGKISAKTGANKVKMISGGDMNNLNSRVGFKGVEDLGQGLKVGFQFETGIDLNDGDTLTSGAGYWGRQANLWIGGDWGTFKMGRALTPSFNAAAVWELTGFANYSIVANTYGFGADSSRNNSQFMYSTPDFMGFQADVAYVLKHDNHDKAKWDLGLKYKNGPIGVGLSANKTKSSKTNWALGGQYDFGQFAVAASYSDRRSHNYLVEDVVTNTFYSVDARRRGVSIGGKARFDAFDVTLDVTRDTKKFGGWKKHTNALLEGKYHLSKRTFAYAAYQRWDGTNNYGIGLQHRF